MLQQTTVAAVVGYFERWMSRFPTVETLANAGEHEVLAMWEGLGYYSRARNLHRAARQIVEHHNGILPSDLEALRALPGIGPYTAAAVISFAFNKHAPALDANVLRVIARLHNFSEPSDTPAARKALEEMTSALLPEKNPGRTTAAIMELGALICVAGPPRCELCPIRPFCRAEKPSELPVKRPRPKTTEITDRRAFATRGGQDGAVLLRFSTGPRWRGLWVLPEFTPTTVARGTPLLTTDYTITRYRVRLEIYGVRARSAKEGESWVPVRQLELIPVASPFRKVLSQIFTPPEKQTEG